MEGEEVDERDETEILQKLQQYHLPAFVAGVALILLLVVLNRGMRTSIGLAVVGKEIVTPVRIALIGLGTGYYLGDALRQNNSGIVAFHVGAFLALLVLTVVSIQVQPLGLVLAFAVLFALAMNVSSIVDSHADIRDAFDALARDVSRGGLIFVVIVQYSVSLYIWSGTQLSSFSLIEKGIILLFGFFLLYVSFHASRAVTQWQKPSEEQKTTAD
ncbi:hypothetical protein C440_04783 [Haloferax mucosum ATCC BAA-1512]|uniref:Uncharacterized protein n=1 Tax=Haloferax mucosum ATCC BAA-1512 TaxID=662479 RepID=M0ILU6_9EURY|nr:hypothetical protein [Haloferax mucosum]ELZ96434.1 hypothetical protein C440_04783 [Haloferax mucosum ATCC BAA-1512]